MFNLGIIFWIWFWSITPKKTATRGCIVIATLISLSVFPQTVRLNIIMFTFLSILSVPLFHYCSITYDVLFCSLNINKASKQHIRVSLISFSWQVSSLSNRCTFSLANGFYGRFISRYWVSWIGFGLCPSRQLVWHLSTQVNIGILDVYITVFDPRRGKRGCFMPF